MIIIFQNFYLKSEPLTDGYRRTLSLNNIQHSTCSMQKNSTIVIKLQQNYIENNATSLLYEFALFINLSALFHTSLINKAVEIKYKKT